MSRRTQRGAIFWLALALLTYGLVSVGIAISTSGDCPDGVSQTWAWVPPEWECGP